MGVFDDSGTLLPERRPDESDEEYWDRVAQATDRVQAREEGATAPAPPAPPVCPECGLDADRYPTLSQAWVLLEHLDPVNVLPAHMVPPRFRWLINADGVAWNPWLAEPTPGALCRIPHRLVCPGLEPVKAWSWLTAAREENERRAQRLYNPPQHPDSDRQGTGKPAASA
ncbi:DUF6083 domain-containing protein [Streptomyces sp. NPDC005968]|uniref:DUF6083 domain-containing protein n=1 Tax=Streptomyces sp. NPDC005968 TaxID=3154574 RepID=UPI0033DD0151